MGEDFGYKVATLCIISFLYVAQMYLLFVPALLSTALRIANLVFFNFCVFMLLFCYFSASWTDAGATPSGYNAPRLRTRMHTHSRSHSPKTLPSSAPLLHSDASIVPCLQLHTLERNDGAGKGHCTAGG